VAGEDPLRWEGKRTETGRRKLAGLGKEVARGREEGTGPIEVDSRWPLVVAWRWVRRGEERNWNRETH